MFWGYSLTAARENKGSLLSFVSLAPTQSSRVRLWRTVESVGEIRDAEKMVLVAWEERWGQLS